MSDAEGDPLRAVRLAKRDELRAHGIDPYPYEFARTSEAAELEQRYAGLTAGAETGERVCIAGRIRAMRNSGMFIDLYDASGKIQIFCHRDGLDAQGLSVLRLLDIGDLIGVEGLVRRYAFWPRPCARCPRNITVSPMSSCAIASAIST
jgi:lysyl-tRNA synthetase, class II